MQVGQHAILFGERGVGKTSLANVLFEYLGLSDPEEEARTPVVSPRVNCEADDNFDRVWRKVFRRIRFSRSCDALGYFVPKNVCLPLRTITGKRGYNIANFTKHLSEFISEKRGRVLESTGIARSYRYRFRDPLMQPFVIMQGALAGRLPSGFFDPEQAVA